MKKMIFVFAMMTVLLAVVCPSAFAAPSSSQDLNIAYCNLSFESDTHIMYAIKSNDANVKLLVWTEPQSEYTLDSQKATVAPLSEQMTIQEELYTVFKYTGVAAKQMTDNVYVRACIDNGNGDVTYGDVHKYSILQYAYNKLGKTGEATTNEKLVNMLHNMLAYGASAQEYHNYKADRLATDDFVQVQLTDGTLPDGFKHGLYLVGESVTVSAPTQNAQGTAFTQWKDKSGAVVGNTAAYTLTVGSVNNTYTPEYVAYSTGLEFESNGDGTCYLIGIGACTDTDIKIPAKSPDGDTVIGIDRNAFSDETAVTSVSIPVSVEEIGRNAFNGCTALTDVYYDGSASDWALIDIASGNTVIENATKHFAVVESFTVTFVDHNGSVLKTETVNKGASATAPADPTRDGYTFAGWDKAFDNVTGDLTVKATYDVQITEPTIAVSNVSANAGETSVTVTVLIHQSPALSSIAVEIVYDESVMTLKTATSGTALNGASYTAPKNMKSGCSALWYANDPIQPNGTQLLVLTFDISATAAAGDYGITVNGIPMDTLDGNGDEVTFDSVTGNVTVQ